MSYTTAPTPAPADSRAADLFGRRIAARLDQSAQVLPHDISERLRAARVRAVAQRKREVVVAVHQPRLAVAGMEGQFEQRPSLWNRLASALPVLLLAAGLVAIHTIEADLRASEVADVDAALLIDDLPPAAYADPGFAQFLKTER